MRHLLDTLWTSLLDLVFPPRCEVCRQLQESVICETCLEAFAPVPEPRCRQCGFPLDPLAKTAGECAGCVDDPPPFDAARAAAVFDGSLRKAIHVMKYELTPSLARPLGEYCASHLTPLFPLDCLTPVPLHPARERMRGFNQSLLLAEVIGQAWSIPVEPGVLARVQNTVPQVKLPLAQRRDNIRGAFAIAGEVRDRAVCLVDDVYTTGATLRECSRVLKRAGASRVLVVTLARTVTQ